MLQQITKFQTVLSLKQCLIHISCLVDWYRLELYFLSPIWPSWPWTSFCVTLSNHPPSSLLFGFTFRDPLAVNYPEGPNLHTQMSCIMPLCNYCNYWWSQPVAPGQQILPLCHPVPGTSIRTTNDTI